MLLLGLTLLCLIGSSFSAAVPLHDILGSGSTRNKLLLISFDGFRWDYDRDVDTPHLDKMAQDGVKAKYVTPPFLTITSPTHFTLLTGRYIENHGVIHNMWFNTTTQEKKQYYMTQFVDSYWDNGSLPIWITAQRQGLKAGSLHFPGTAATYREEIVRVRQVEPRFYDHSNETDWRLNIDKVIGEWFHQQDLDFVSLYFGEPDKAGHKYGPDSPERRAMVQQVDRTVGYIRDKIQEHGLTNRLNIIITADHGMTTVLRNGLVEEIILSKIPGFSFRDIKFHLVDYGPVGMLLPKEGMLEKVYQALKGGHPHLHVYKKEEMPARLHYSDHPRLLPIILFADPGYVINGLFPVQFNKGEHGFDNQVMDMKPFFRAVGPDFQKNLVSRPFETINVYPLMCHLLKINPEINDGHLDNTKHMLVPKKNTDGNNKTPEISTHFQAVVGLSAVTGFLVLVFIVTASYTSCKRNRAEKRYNLENAAGAGHDFRVLERGTLLLTCALSAIISHCLNTPASPSIGDRLLPTSQVCLPSSSSSTSLPSSSLSCSALRLTHLLRISTTFHLTSLTCHRCPHDPWLHSPTAIPFLNITFIKHFVNCSLNLRTRGKKHKEHGGHKESSGSKAQEEMRARHRRSMKSDSMVEALEE
ncbi:ectonucleotide pyrophosphatase/phosphodiesterase family member 7-like [Plectropomus leopardus]|uniref:ectonucleotide pyrophosphatase/phosphodiesterase family member 7-like n=1 Tax=Plectropomus leopardus TaxID=160734 RepID=UPI001C4CDED1|nr:ectonucleotide pyrophosphatase/phosphodiesterase family member 7-like [Plectropomus leopardus]